MIYYSKIVKIKMDYITKYQYVKLIHFLRRHHLYASDNSIFVTLLFVNTERISLTCGNALAFFRLSSFFLLTVYGFQYRIKSQLFKKGIKSFCQIAVVVQYTSGEMLIQDSANNGVSQVKTM